jgi:hypothetical protein
MKSKGIKKIEGNDFFNQEHMNSRMFLFGRWMSTVYADEIDEYGLCILNTSDGKWWENKLTFFNERVYPNYLKNGSFNETYKFLKNT